MCFARIGALPSWWGPSFLAHPTRLRPVASCRIQGSSSATYDGAMTVIRHLFLLILGLATVLSSVESAVARSEMAGARFVAFCAQSEMRMAALDPTGHPVDHAHHCPDCHAVGQGLAFLPPVAAPRPADSTMRRLEPGNQHLAYLPFHRPDLPNPRGPPRPI